MTFFRSIVCLLFTSCLCLTAQAQVDLERGLIGCYPFTGNAKDFSPMANDGQVRGATLASDRFGNTNSAYEFDGMDDVIEISPNALQIQNFTYSLWTNPNVASQRTTAFFLFSVGSDYGDQHILFGDHYSNDRHTGLSHGSYMGVANNILCSGPSVEPTGQWYHLVLVKDDSNYTFYVNGRMVCSNSTNGQNAFYGTGTVRATIGARNNFGQVSNGRIDDIHLYNRPLNKEEIDALYKGENVPSEPVSAEITVDKSQICAGEPVLLTVKSNKPGAVFKWKIDEVEQSETSAALLYQTKKSGADYQIKVQVAGDFDRSCFVQTDAFEVDRSLDVKNCAPEQETSGVWIPEIFTPNRDGKNDNWKIINAESVQELRITVYNRWGEVIFHSKGNPGEWDGTYRGKLVPSGNYMFRVLSGNKLIKEGSLMVVY